MANPDEKELLNTTQAHRRVGVSYRTFMRRVKRSNVPRYFCPATNEKKFLISDVDEIAKAMEKERTPQLIPSS